MTVRKVFDTFVLFFVDRILVAGAIPELLTRLTSQGKSTRLSQCGVSFWLGESPALDAGVFFDGGRSVTLPEKAGC